VRLRLDESNLHKWYDNFAALGEQFEKALPVAANMAASMIEEQGKADIAAAGFGGLWTDGLSVEVDGTLANMRISMYHAIPFAGTFEDGGTIQGNPLLWLPISGTDAENTQAKDYQHPLFSVQRRDGKPLLLSKDDKQPKYHGVLSVKIPKKFHLREIQQSVMNNFATVFQAALDETAE
jgi:hypothetical protein